MFVITTRARLNSDALLITAAADIVLVIVKNGFAVHKSRLPHYAPGSVLDDWEKDQLFGEWWQFITEEGKPDVL